MLVRLAAGSCRKFCCSPGVPPLFPQPTASKHGHEGLLALAVSLAKHGDGVGNATGQPTTSYSVPGQVPDHIAASGPRP